MLGSIWLGRYKYLQATRLRGFGRTEDVRTGYFFAVTQGIDMGEFIYRPYSRIDIGLASLFSKYGYASFYLKTGAFSNMETDKLEDAVVDLKSLYYSPLFNFGAFQDRAIFRLNALGYLFRRNEQEFIPVRPFLDDFDFFHPVSESLINTELENVVFAPWYIYGFHFAFYQILKQ
jgi:hypothetical protein